MDKVYNRGKQGFINMSIKAVALALWAGDSDWRCGSIR